MIEEREIKPVGQGSLGPIFDQFRGKSKDAINFLLKLQDGEAIDALHHKSVGDIDLVWGEEGTGHSDGYGLAKIAKYHPEVLDNLQELLDDMYEVNRSDNRVNLENQTHQATVRLTWNNRAKKWLLTAFEKKNSALDNTTDTGETPKGKRNDTATPQNTVSDCEDSENSDTSNENVENFSNAELRIYTPEQTAGFENLERLRQREQLWEEGAENSISSTDTASANVTTVTSQQGGEMPGSASNQSASLSDCEDSENSDTSNEIDEKI